MVYSICEPGIASWISESLSRDSLNNCLSLKDSLVIRNLLPVLVAPGCTDWSNLYCSQEWPNFSWESHQMLYDHQAKDALRTKEFADPGTVSPSPNSATVSFSVPMEMTRKTAQVCFLFFVYFLYHSLQFSVRIASLPYALREIQCILNSFDITHSSIEATKTVSSLHMRSAQCSRLKCRRTGYVRTVFGFETTRRFSEPSTVYNTLSSKPFFRSAIHGESGLGASEIQRLGLAVNMRLWERGPTYEPSFQYPKYPKIIQNPFTNRC